MSFYEKKLRVSEKMGKFAIRPYYNKVNSNNYGKQISIRF